MPALSLKRIKPLDELNVCVYTVVRKLFNYNKWESMKSVLFHIDRLNVTHLIMMPKINFYHRLRASKNYTLYNVLCRFLSRGCDIVWHAVFTQWSL